MQRMRQKAQQMKDELLEIRRTIHQNPDFGKPMHNESVVFNEEILPLGAAIFAHCAQRWLEQKNN